MTTRRQFLIRGGAGAAASLLGASNPEIGKTDPNSRAGELRASRQKAHVAGALRRDETIVRHGGVGDIFPLTWAADDRQFGSLSDGLGWSSSAKVFYNTRAFWINGGPENAIFDEVDIYRNPMPVDSTSPPYYGFSTLAVEERIYQLFCCMERSSSGGVHWNGVKLIFSADGGRAWHNQDGSTPVTWEPYRDLSRRTMLFVNEPEGTFPLVSLLQMGKNYRTNRDGFVYGYGTNGTVDGRMNQLVMFRVPKSKVLERHSYEFFCGIESRGRATWTKDIRERAVVHTFPRGWVNTPRGDQNVVQSWVPSVVYNEPLNLYLMVSSGVGCPDTGDWFSGSRPSYLGLWLAQSPWGPWHQIHEETAWTPGGDSGARCYSPQIPSKWIAGDGKSFWLVWSDLKGVSDGLFEQATEQLAKREVDENERARLFRECFRQYRPYYGFNTQRFDLLMA